MRRPRRTGPGGRGALAAVAGLLASCASVSTSQTRPYPLGTSQVQVSARAERGALADRLFIVVDGSDVASGPFGPEQAAGTILRGSYDGVPVEARCAQRWRPGLHIAYRCSVVLGDGEPVELRF